MRQSPKKPRRSVMEAAARAQVKKKVNYFNQLAGSSTAPTSPQPAAKHAPSSRAATATSVVAAVTSVTVAISETHVPPPPPPQEPAATDYTSVFGRLNLGVTLTDTIATVSCPTGPTAVDCSSPADMLVSPPASQLPAMGQVQQQAVLPDSQQLARDLQQLTLAEEEEEEEADDKVEEGTAMMEVTVATGSAQPPAMGDEQQQPVAHVAGESAGRESMEEVLCDFRTGFVKPLTTTTKPPPAPPCCPTGPAPPSQHATAAGPPAAEPSRTTPVQAEEEEGPEPIIECNQKKPAAVPRHHTPSEQQHQCQPGDSQGGGGAAHFFKSIGLGKIASAFHLAPPQQPVDGMAAAMAKVRLARMWLHSRRGARRLTRDPSACVCRWQRSPPSRVSIPCRSHTPCQTGTAASVGQPGHASQSDFFHGPGWNCAVIRRRSATTSVTRTTRTSLAGRSRRRSALALRMRFKDCA